RSLYKSGQSETCIPGCRGRLSTPSPERGPPSGRIRGAGALLLQDPRPQLVPTGGQPPARLQEALEGGAGRDVPEVVLDQLAPLLLEKVVLDQLTGEAPDSRCLVDRQSRGHAQQSGRRVP